MDKYYKHVELPEYPLVNDWSHRFERIKLHYNVSEYHGLLSDIYLFRKLHMGMHRYIYIYIPSFEVISDKTHKNVKIKTDEELEAMEWIIKDTYSKQEFEIMNRKFKFKLNWA